MPKGLSAEEKRKRLLDAFYESMDFFVLKEVEKMATKRGIVLMSVKDVLQSLVDDNMVNQEKIGQSNFFWSFPSQKVVQRRCALAKFRAEQDALGTKLVKAQEDLVREQNGRSSKGRRALIKEYGALRAEQDSVDDLLKKYGRCDPVKYKEKKRSLAEKVAETNGITEKLFTVQDYVCRKFNIGRREFCESFGIDEALDYVE